MAALLEVFSFPHFMLAALFIAPLFLMLAAGAPLIAWLKRLKGMKWSPREDTPDSHLSKSGTPSMGGIGIIGTALIGYAAVLLFVGLTEGLVFGNGPGSGPSLVTFALLLPLMVGCHALLGLADDWSKARGTGGMLARQKLIGQVVLAVAFLIGMQLISRNFSGFFGSTTLQNMSIGAFVFSLLIIIGTSNAVNLTDGIDGLAAGLSVQCAAAFATLILALNVGSSDIVWSFATLFFWICIGGACLGFLAFNKYPAKVFMGDTGSLALGAALGAGAILTRSVFLLPFIGFIFYVEMFSVIFQVLYFKTTKKRFGEGQRIFRRAPLHHHYELGGWSEWRVVGTFWLVNLFTSIVGLTLWKMGILPRFP